MALTVKRIAKLTEPGRYSDGGNLFLQVTLNGGRSWLFRWERKGPDGRRTQRGMGLGPSKTSTWTRPAPAPGRSGSNCGTVSTLWRRGTKSAWRGL
jgi:hypothetical protein